jgi:Holliday junction resolvase RusA-like endonuclease
MPRLKLPEREAEHIAEIDKHVFIHPVPKPRQTKSDVWNKRPSVVSYRNFADKLRLSFGLKEMEKFKSARTVRIVFTLYKKGVDGMSEPHLQRPDIDNLAKAVLDSLIEKDEMVQQLDCSKRFGKQDSIDVVLGDVEKYIEP